MQFSAVFSEITRYTIREVTAAQCFEVVEKQSRLQRTLWWCLHSINVYIVCFQPFCGKALVRRLRVLRIFIRFSGDFLKEEEQGNLGRAGEKFPIPVSATVRYLGGAMYTLK